MVKACISRVVAKQPALTSASPTAPPGSPLPAFDKASAIEAVPHAVLHSVEAELRMWVEPQISLKVLLFRTTMIYTCGAGYYVW